MLIDANEALQTCIALIEEIAGSELSDDEQVVVASVFAQLRQYEPAKKAFWALKTTSIGPIHFCTNCGTEALKVEEMREIEQDDPNLQIHFLMSYDEHTTPACPNCGAIMEEF
jgi:hypothetical protein